MDLISKKELLASTGISYGQLYRWKRERLIPEDWFIKKSSFTGQETFFPREQVLARVRSILDLKDDHSLEELARILSPDTEITVTAEGLQTMDVLESEILARLSEIPGKKNFTVDEIAFAYGLGGAAKTAGITSAQMTETLLRGLPVLGTLKMNDMQCTVFTANGTCHVCFSAGRAPVVFDKTVAVLATLPLAEMVNTLKTKLAAEKGVR
jgi:hypothetical protein